MIPAPLFNDIAEGPAGGAAFWLTAADGVRLRIGHWGGGNRGNRGSILIFTGRTEMVEKYGRTAGALLERGYSCVVIDWRGQGLADRLTDDPVTGHVRRFADYQLDVAALTDALEALGTPGPHYLLAHSMGGAIGLRALAGGLKVRAACFSAPMWGIAIPAHLRPLARMGARLAVGLGLARRRLPGKLSDSYVAAMPFEGNDLTGDPQMFAYMKRQLAAHPELALGHPSFGWLDAALAECPHLRALPLPALPALIWVGSCERVVDAAAIRRLAARWPGARLSLLNGARHEALFETPEIRTHMLDETCGFFARHGPEAENP